MDQMDVLPLLVLWGLFAAFISLLSKLAGRSRDGC